MSNKTAWVINKVPISIIKEKLEYRDGCLFWKYNGRNQFIKKGKRAGWIDGRYRRVEINKTSMREHNVIWALVNDLWPKNLIDHIDGNGLNNKIENLRDVTQNVNMQNKKNHREGACVGVYLCKCTNRWRAIAPKKFMNRNKPHRYDLGRFETKEKAFKAVLEHCSVERPK